MLWRFPLLRWRASEGAFARRNSKWRLCQRRWVDRGGAGSAPVSEAHLIAPSCSDPPEGKARWSMGILADRMVELGYVQSVSYDTVSRTLKNSKKPRLKRQWVIPPRKSAAFVWRMEEVLDLYEEPYDPRRPVVFCFDERSCQLMGDVREPLPMEPGRIERFDLEYERGGVCWVLTTSTQQPESDRGLATCCPIVPRVPLSTCLMHPSVGVIGRNRFLVSLLPATGAPSRVLVGWQRKNGCHI